MANLEKGNGLPNANKAPVQKTRPLAGAPPASPSQIRRMGVKDGKPSQQALRPVSESGKQIKLIVMMTTFILLVVLIALVFLLQVNGKSLISAMYDYITGNKPPAVEIRKADPEVIGLFNKTVDEIKGFDKKADDLTEKLNGINEWKKIETFIGDVKLEKTNLEILRDKILRIKYQCREEDLANLKIAELDAAIETFRKMEAKLDKVREEAYKKITELRKKEQGDDSVVVQPPKKDPVPKAPQKPEEIVILMKWDSVSATTSIQVNAKAISNNDELEKLLGEIVDGYKKDGKDFVVIIDAEPQLTWQSVVSVMDICKKLKIEYEFRKEKGNE